MKINCYYSISPYEDQHKWCAVSIFESIYQTLEKLYPTFTIELIDSVLHSYKLGIHHHGFPGCKFGYHRMIIENDVTKKYFIINYADLLTSIHEINGWDVDNVAEIFSSTGAHKDFVYFKSNGINYTPASYCLRSVESEEYIRTNPTKTKSKVSLYFRGNTYLFRGYLVNDDRFDIRTDTLDELDYIKELQDNYISLSLNGTGEICHRDIESFACSCAVIRPKLTVKFNDPLVENFHYIAVEVNDLYNLEPYDFYKELSDRIYSKFLKVKDDLDYLNYIGSNAYEWYIRNGTIAGNVRTITNLLNFDKLL